MRISGWNVQIVLGPLTGNIGDQNYEIPNDLDISEFGSIRCSSGSRESRVNSTAPLTPIRHLGARYEGPRTGAVFSG